MPHLFQLFEETELKNKDLLFVTVILPLPLPKLYTYSVPIHLVGLVKKGVRVEVQFRGNKLYAGLIYDIFEQAPTDFKTKPILSVLDEEPIVTEKQFALWSWIANYYLCTMGELMQAALPAGFKLESETTIILAEQYEDQQEFLSNLNPRENFIMESLMKKPELTIDEIQKLCPNYQVRPLLKKMLEKKLITILDELQEKYKPKMLSMVELSDIYKQNPSLLADVFKEISRSGRQTEALMSFIQLCKEQQISYLSRKQIYEKANVDSSVLNAMAKKGIFKLFEIEISRLIAYEQAGTGNYELSDIQNQALSEIKTQFETKNAILLHGVTGSGKTQVFVELIQEIINEGKQVLYLLPEIGLTAQMVGRLQRHFGDKVLTYHSKFNSFERVEIWNKVLNGCPVILGARSALFLPFQNLGLILVDEEHDPSYKQTDPNPRYNARDTAVYLAHLYKCKTLLGTATPSVETYYNVLQKKYGLVEMKNRFGGLSLPDVLLVDIKEETKRKQMKSHFSPQLLQAITDCFANGEQVILFQNRRGYAPAYRCKSCGWAGKCTRCDVSMTYHHDSHDLHCHYCGLAQHLPKHCPACGSASLHPQGFGTEKIEDDVKIYFPDIQTARMDLDTVKGKTGADKIIQSFEKREVQILIGTQMVTKGLDFDNVGLVGVISADQMLQFPDFRATERAYQLLTQVAGRAGRKKKQGKVFIQTYNTEHPVLWELKNNNFEDFLQRELSERQHFGYPPFSKLIGIQLKHKREEIARSAADYFAKALKSQLGDRVLGPAVPPVGKIREYFLIDILLKLSKDSQTLQLTKQLITQTQEQIQNIPVYKGLRILVDIDPY
jgi:primosomal protein N' (replication factor Y) (superfamily II helicase)